jgi:PAS domain S-box-containing protein
MNKPSYEELMSENEARFREVLDNSADASYKRNLKTNTYEYFSPAIERITGFRVEDMKSLSLDKVLELIHPDDRVQISHLFKSALSEPVGKLYDADYRFKHIGEGEYRWLHDKFRITYDFDGKPEALIGSVTDITDRKNAEVLLNITHQNYETFFNTIDDFLFVLDETGNMIHINATVLDRLGYSSEELIGKSVLFVHPPERREEAGFIVGEMLRGKAELCPVPLITKSGIQIPVETRVKEGTWYGKPAIFGVTKDISRIQLSEEKFSKLFHLNPSACGLSDMESYLYIEVNQAFVNLFGYTRDEAVGKTAYDLGILTPEIAEELMRSADSSGKITDAESRLFSKNGETKYVLLSAENISIQNKKYRFTVVHDITERKQMENELKKYTARLSIATRAGEVGVWDFDFKKNTLVWDDQMFLLYGIEKSQFKGKYSSWLNCLHPADRTETDMQIQMAIRDKKEINIEFRVLLPNGTIRNIRALAVVEWNAARIPVRMVGTNIDITQWKQREQEIRQQNEKLQQLNATKDKFFSIIAHDLKSPFNSLICFSELLLEQIQDKNYEGIEQYAEIIHKASQRGMDLLTNLMEWSRSQTGKLSFNPEFFELVEVIQEVSLMAMDIAGSKSITINFDLPHHAPVYADKEMINTIMRNLVSNAIKFTNPGGEIKISVERQQKDIIVTIADSGIGISEQRIETLFQISESISTPGTQNETGTGLGLILCKEFIDKHGGKIWVESIEGQGSKFRFLIPGGK